MVQTFNCNLCEITFESLIILKKHTIECITKDSIKASTDDEDDSRATDSNEGKTIIEPDSMLPVDLWDEDEDNDKHPIEENVNDPCEKIKEEVSDDTIMHIIETAKDEGEYIFVDLQQNIEAQNKVLEAMTDVEQQNITNQKSEQKKINNNFIELKCPECPKVYLKKSGLKEHRRIAHVREECVCDTCAKTFPNKRYLSGHVRRVHKENIHKKNIDEIECLQCRKTFHTEYWRDLHIQSVHIIDHCSCEKCGKEYKNTYRLKQHELRYHASKDFQSQDREEKYMRRINKKGPTICDQCSKTFKTELRMRRHMKNVHSQTNVFYPCQHCKRPFKSKSRKDRHIKMVHVLKEVSCETCGKIYKNESVLRTHVLWSCQEAASCETCGNDFKNRTMMTKHVKTCHTSPKAL